MALDITQIDFNNPQQSADLILLLDAYAKDPMGGGEPLSAYSKDNLADRLKKLDYCRCYIGYENNKPVVLANCFLGFSTFACKPLINIHDLAVLEEHRGKGYARAILNHVAEEARKLDCCKVTLEVLSGNEAAMSAYLNFGFKAYQLDENAGTAQFLELKL